MEYTGPNTDSGIVTNDKSPNSSENKMALTDDNTKVKFTNSNSFPVEASRNGDAKVEIENIQVAFAGMGKEELLKFANDPFWIRLRWFLFFLFWLLWLAMLVGAVVIIVLAPRCAPLPVLDWWQKNVIYHIYPRSFQDTNGDGIGDLKGIESRVEHLDTIGAKSVMLGPIYESPMKDFGYDVIDHTKIDAKFGSMNDFESLIKELNQRDIKLIMDFIPNHTSNQSTWFIESCSKTGNYTEYYVWRNGTDGGPPNNWLSVFGGSAWTYNEVRQQYYLHQFYPEQPDLNLRNPAVKEELQKILKFWLDHGVNGFRVDAIPHLYEDNEFKNEPLSQQPEVNKSDYNYLDHIYTTNQAETFELLLEWRQFLDEYEENNGGGHRLLIVEAIQPLNTTMKYYGNETQKLADFPLNFDFLKSLGKHSNGSSIESSIRRWLDAMPALSWPNWVLGTHDDKRITSRMEPELIDGLHMITMLLKGTPITYYGEEIGMLDISLEDDQYQDILKRDPSRSPMQWNSSIHAGFSTNQTTWLPVHANYSEINVQQQLLEEQSHLKIFQALVKLRKQAAITFGSLGFFHVGENILGFSRIKKGSPGFAVLVNFGNNNTAFSLNNLPKLTPEYNPIGATDLSYKFPDDGTIEINSLRQSANAEASKSRIKLNNVKLDPKQAVVIKFVPNFN
uniref:alpha-glucosidase n=1 Tax=Hemiscolopendra marginata TaxID=943146 RepID=A0A646QFB4_9MYRI